MVGVKNILYLFVLIFCASSCQKDIDINYNSFQSRLVINSAFNQDSLFTVYVSKTGNIADDKDNIGPVEYASVFISCDDPNEEKRVLTHMGEGKYVASNYYPSVGKEYYLEVRAAGFDIASSHNRIPTDNTVIQMDTSSFISPEGNTALQIDFTIENLTNESSYFIYDLIKNYGIVPPKSGIDFFQTEEWLQEAWLNSLTSDTDKITETNGLQTKIFRESLSGNTSSIDASIISYENFNTELPDSSLSNPEDLKLYLRVMSVSQELYNYSKSMEYYRLHSNSNSNYSQPLEIYTNIEGGLGIFGGYSQTLIEL